MPTQTPTRGFLSRFRAPTEQLELTEAERRELIQSRLRKLQLSDDLELDSRPWNKVSQAADLDELVAELDAAGVRGEYVAEVLRRSRTTYAILSTEEPTVDELVKIGIDPAEIGAEAVNAVRYQFAKERFEELVSAIREELPTYVERIREPEGVEGEELLKALSVILVFSAPALFAGSHRDRYPTAAEAREQFLQPRLAWAPVRDSWRGWQLWRSEEDAGVTPALRQPYNAGTSAVTHLAWIAKISHERAVDVIECVGRYLDEIGFEG